MTQYLTPHPCSVSVLQGAKALALFLALTLMPLALMAPAPALAANSGGVVVPSFWSGYDGYIGTLDGSTPTPTGGNVTIDSDVGTSSALQSVVGGFSDSSGDATGNRVTMRGGTVWGIVYGGFALNIGVNANYNTVAISGGTVDGAVHGGHSDIGNANYNTVTISGGTIGGSVHGGFSSDANGTADYNTVTISGGTIGGSVYGGLASGFTGTANHNTVTISGAPVFAPRSILYGGYRDGTGEVRTGNTLNMFAGGISIKNIENFQHYTFAIPTNGNAGLTLIGGAATDMDAAGIAATISSAPYALPGGGLKVGDKATLLKNDAGLTFAQTPTFNNGQAKQGVALMYDYTLSLDDPTDPTSIFATVTGVSVAPESKALSEGRAASIGFANLGADLIAGAGMDAVRGAAAQGGKGLSGGSEAGYGLIPFFAIQGSSLRYNTGSHVDVNGVAMMTGLAKKWEAPNMDVLAGVFFEAAFGSYKTHNSIGGLGSVDGKGDTRTLGGGLLARLDVTNSALKGLYAEGSFRVGSLNNDYKNSNLRDPLNNNAAQYDSNSTYYGAHAGLGYIWQFTDKASLDVYGKYFWTHQQGQDVRILGDTFSFKDTDSQRTRVGARLSYTVNEFITPYIGAAWEHEFDGKARATVYGYDVPGPSIKGSTGVGEIGLTWKPAAQSPLSVDFGVQGYVGMREGVSGNVQLRYEF